MVATQGFGHRAVRQRARFYIRNRSAWRRSPPDARNPNRKIGNGDVRYQPVAARLGAKEIFASAADTIFTSPVPVRADRGNSSARRSPPPAGRDTSRRIPPIAKDAKLRTMSLKKGAQALNVFITVAPAQNNATSVQYSALPLKTDLPFTKDASDIEYSPERPLLILVTGEPVDKTLDFYRKELAARGWALWSEKTERQAGGGRAVRQTCAGAAVLPNTSTTKNRR